MEPRRERLGARTLPCDCGEKRRIKGVWMSLDVFGREIRERGERGSTQNLLFLQNEGTECIYSWILTLQLPIATQCALATPADIDSSSFFWFSFGRVFKGLSKLGFSWSCVRRKLWMSSFQNTKEIGNPTVRSKVMALGIVLTRFAQFSGYLNYFNFDFNP